jgi:hypothetical protein
VEELINAKIQHIVHSKEISLEDGSVVYKNNSTKADYKQSL